MRKILFSLFATAALCATDVMKAQTVLFEDRFETYTDFAIANVGNWRLNLKSCVQIEISFRFLQ